MAGRAHRPFPWLLERALEFAPLALARSNAALAWHELEGIASRLGERYLGDDHPGALERRPLQLAVPDDAEGPAPTRLAVPGIVLSPPSLLQVTNATTHHAVEIVPVFTPGGGAPPSLRSRAVPPRGRRRPSRRGGFLEIESALEKVEPTEGWLRLVDRLTLLDYADL